MMLQCAIESKFLLMMIEITVMNDVGPIGLRGAGAGQHIH